MQIIRDEQRVFMIPIFTQYDITRCNIKDCKELHTTVCLHELAIFGLCEKHYKEFSAEDKEVKISLEF